MDKRLKVKWVKALRSGKYKQARSVLLKKKTGGMCCMGVLAAIQGCPRSKLEGVSSILPPRGYTAGLTHIDGSKLSNMNDGTYEPAVRRVLNRHGFKRIADYIEAHL